MNLNLEKKNILKYREIKLYSAKTKEGQNKYLFNSV